MRITSGLLHISTVLDCGCGFNTRCWAPWALGHRCKATKPVSGNKHLSCANWSVKCTNCRGEDDVSVGGDSSGCGLRVRSYHIMITPLARAHIIPIVPLLGTAHADSHSGNCYLLDVCLICCHSSWLAFIGQRGRVAPEGWCHCRGAAVAK